METLSLFLVFFSFSQTSFEKSNQTLATNTSEKKQTKPRNRDFHSYQSTVERRLLYKLGEHRWERSSLGEVLLCWVVGVELIRRQKREFLTEESKRCEFLQRERDAQKLRILKKKARLTQKEIEKKKALLFFRQFYFIFIFSRDARRKLPKCMTTVHHRVCDFG